MRWKRRWKVKKHTHLRKSESWRWSKPTKVVVVVLPSYHRAHVSRRNHNTALCFSHTSKTTTNNIYILNWLSLSLSLSLSFFSPFLSLYILVSLSLSYHKGCWLGFQIEKKKLKTMRVLGFCQMPMSKRVTELLQNVTCKREKKIKIKCSKTNIPYTMIHTSMHIRIKKRRNTDTLFWSCVVKEKNHNFS